MNKLLLSLSLVLMTLLCGQQLKAQPNGSITQGLGKMLIQDLMPNCKSNHVTPLGEITSTDNKRWSVPSDSTFISAPKLKDLYNQCNNILHNSLESVKLEDVPITTINPDGEIITGYLFADNYFELYINGQLIGVDAVPFTPFNSSIVRFRVTKPYTIAVKLVDWEEHVGLGMEIQSQNKQYYAGDGGFIAQFSDGTVTDATWKTQSFYIAPIQNLEDVIEQPNGIHSTVKASTSPSCSTSCYGIHYDIPGDWNKTDFNDLQWPNAFVYNASEVTSQSAYTNFAKSAWKDAKFIWSSNLFLDNVVLTRKTVTNTTDVIENLSEQLTPYCEYKHGKIIINSFPNRFANNVILTDYLGNEVTRWVNVSFGNENKHNVLLDTKGIGKGAYFLTINDGKQLIPLKFFVREEF